MIETRRERVPWSWTALLALPCGVEALVESCSGAAITFTLWKFTQDPALLAFLGSVNLAFGSLIAPLAAWQSDHMWTQWGRRIPFMIVGWSILIVALVVLPLAGSLWVLIAVIIAYYAAVDIGFTGPWTPLYFEVVPRAQRGRAIVLKRVAMIGGQVLFNVVLIGRFDEVYHWRLPMAAGGGSVTITGEAMIYLVAGVMVLAALVLVVARVREVRPEAVEREAFSLGRYLRSMLNARQRWPVYLLAFSAVAMGACLGQLQPLLITQQFGYSKQVLGNMFAIALAVEIGIALPLLGCLADRVSRLRLYQATIVMAGLLPLVFWVFIKFVAARQIPTPGQIIVFMVGHSVVRTAGILTVEPLFFDQVDPDEMGRMYSGLLMVRGVGGGLVLNGVGWWVKGYSWLFPLGGSMRNDYTSAYLYMVLFAVVALGATVLYATKFGHGAMASPGREARQGAAVGEGGAASRPMGGGCAICPHAGKM